MSSSWLRPFYIISLILVLICSLKLTFSLGQWLNPAPSDVRLSFEQTSPSENTFLPQEALDNHMPQLGKFPFWVDGKLTEEFGRFSPYASRYLLFLLSLGMMFYLFVRYIKPPEENLTEWSLLFLLSLSGSFFFAIKFFFWLDYVVTIPLALALVILVRRNTPAILIFALILLILYVKISAVFILLTFFGIFANTEIVRKYKTPLLSATLISVAIFFMRWGFGPLSDRGSSVLMNFPGYVLTGMNFIAAPWNMIDIFDKNFQKLVTDLSSVLVLKTVLFVAMIAWLIVKKVPGVIFRILCVLLGFTITLLLLRDTPTLHDFSAYSGVIELGCLSLIWIFYRATTGKLRMTTLMVMILVTGIQFNSWNSAIRNVQAGVPKFSLTGKLLELTADGESHLFLFCSGNVGEFEYSLKHVNIHYLLRSDPFEKKEYLSARPSILLIPKRCQHEEVTPLMKQNYSAIISETNARHLETVQIDGNQIYEIYEVR